MRDSEIVVDDDAPAWTPEMFARAVVKRGLDAPPTKTLLSLRVDADVVEWFRAQGRGYQSRMNALLRASWTRIAPVESVRANPAVNRTRRFMASTWRASKHLAGAPVTLLVRPRCVVRQSNHRWRLLDVFA